VDYLLSVERQALKEFQAYQTPDDGRLFTELYVVQHLTSSKLSPAAAVVNRNDFCEKITYSKAFLPLEWYAADHSLTACGVIPSARAISDGDLPFAGIDRPRCRRNSISPRSRLAFRLGVGRRFLGDVLHLQHTF
jgi:hypothetical protein